MNSAEFRRAGKEMIDFVANYLDSIHERQVLPSVEPFYLEKLLPDSAPTNGEPFDEIFGDIEKFIMPGVSRLTTLKFRKKSSFFSYKMSFRTICTLKAKKKKVFFAWK